jgi:hypothetical protein
MTPKLTETEQEVAWTIYANCREGTRKGVYAAVEAVLAMRDDYARGRESGIREALKILREPDEITEAHEEAMRDPRILGNWQGGWGCASRRLARLLPAKEPTPEQRVEAILMRHKFRADACEYVAAEIVADLARAGKEQK